MSAPEFGYSGASKYVEALYASEGVTAPLVKGGTKVSAPTGEFGALVTDALVIPDELITKPMISLSSLPSQPGQVVDFVWVAEGDYSIAGGSYQVADAFHYVGPAQYLTWVPPMMGRVVGARVEFPKLYASGSDPVGDLSVTISRRTPAPEEALWTITGAQDTSAAVVAGPAEAAVADFGAAHLDTSFRVRFTIPAGEIYTGVTARVSLIVSYDDHGVPSATTGPGNSLGGFPPP